MKLILHPLCEALPEMSAEQFVELKASIFEHGVREPVVVVAGAILDGRHRWRAAEELGKPCPTVEWDPSIHGESMTVFVATRNLQRRHLTPSQRAMVAIALVPHFEAEARDRQRTTLKQGKNAPTSESSRCGKIATTGKSRDQAAKAAGVSARMVQDAKKLATVAPELADRVKRGQITVSEAKKRLTPDGPPPSTDEVDPSGAATIKDELGAEITDPAMVEVFTTGKERFDTLIRQINTVLRDVRDIRAGELGKHFSAAQQLEIDLKNARTTLKSNRPFALCPFAPNCSSDRCKACRGTKWLGSHRYRTLPAELKNGAPNVPEDTEESD